MDDQLDFQTEFTDRWRVKITKKLKEVDIAVAEARRLDKELMWRRKMRGSLLQELTKRVNRRAAKTERYY